MRTAPGIAVEAAAWEGILSDHSRPLRNHISFPDFPPRIRVEGDHSADKRAALYIEASR